MGSKTIAIDEYAFIAQKLKELEAAKLEALNAPAEPEISTEPLPYWQNVSSADYCG